MEKFTPLFTKRPLLYVLCLNVVGTTFWKYNMFGVNIFGQSLEYTDNSAQIESNGTMEIASTYAIHDIMV